MIKFSFFLLQLLFLLLCCSIELVFSKGSLCLIYRGLRLRLFRLKRISGNHFTPAYLFGIYRKLDQTEIILRVDYKIKPLTCKTISGFILPSNDFHARKIEKREKQQEEIAPEATPDRTTAPNPKSYWSCCTIASARSHSQTILTRTHKHHTLTNITHLKISAHLSLIVDPQTTKTHLSDRQLCTDEYRLSSDLDN